MISQRSQCTPRVVVYPMRKPASARYSFWGTLFSPGNTSAPRPMISPTPSAENLGPKTAIAADRVPMEVGVRACSNGLGRSSDGSGIGFLLIVDETN